MAHSASEEEAPSIDVDVIMGTLPIGGNVDADDGNAETEAEVELDADDIIVYRSDDNSFINSWRGILFFFFDSTNLHPIEMVVRAIRVSWLRKRGNIFWISESNLASSSSSRISENISGSSSSPS